MSSAGTSPRGWLFGPFPDLLLGCGLGYLALFGVFAIGGAELRQSQSVAVIAFLTLFVSGPHYGGTLLRVYEQRSDRRAYSFFTLWATLAVALLFVAAVHQPLVGAWMFTVYITWSPWHYTGQNYGLALMLMGRRGVDTSPPVKRLLHASFVGSFLITAMVLHGSEQASGYVPNPTDYGQPAIGFIKLGLPHELARAVLVAATAVHAVALVTALGLILRRSGLRRAAPACAILLLQVVWFSIPFSLTYWGIQTGIDPLDNGVISHYVVWTAMGHALQYLWVTTYYARASPTWSSYPLYFAKVLASGAAIWTLPGIVFAGGHLGTLASAEGLILLTAAAVNLHHFILDGAIWKLRNSRVASVLIRSAPETATDPSEPGRSWLRPAVWGLCSLATLVAVATRYVEHFTLPQVLRGDDAEETRSTLDWLARVGHEKPGNRARLAQALARQGDVEVAEAEFRHSLALRPTHEALVGLARLLGQRGDYAGVVALWEEYPEDMGSAPRLAGAATNAYYALGRVEDARRVLDEAVRYAGGDARAYSQFGDAARAHGDFELAIRYYRESLAQEPGRRAAANNLAWVLATATDAALRAPEEALRLARQVVASSPSPDANQLDTLGAAQAANGHFAAAIETTHRALALARAAGDADLTRTLESRVRLYRQGQPFRLPPR